MISNPAPPVAIATVCCLSPYSAISLPTLPSGLLLDICELISAHPSGDGIPLLCWHCGQGKSYANLHVVNTDSFVEQELVLEKESRIRESMLMMGLKQWVLWGSWFLKQFLFLLISVFIIAILVKV